MGTKNNPGAFDCYANAEPDEPMFVLLGRDPAAPPVIRDWCDLRVGTLLNAKDDPQIVEARECADAMEQYGIDRSRRQADAVVERATQALLSYDSALEAHTARALARVVVESLPGGDR